VTIKFEIFQRKIDKAWFLPIHPDKIKSSDYEKTFEGVLKNDSEKNNDFKTLDYLFHFLNSDDRPTKNYTYSLSVNDIVKLNEQSYICLFIGWVKLDNTINIENVNKNFITVH
jgi:hypothetical protein